jgi:hypothetical protein
VFSSSVDEDIKRSSLAPMSVENEIPKEFSFTPLPAEQHHLLYDWYTENDNEFSTLFDHVVLYTERNQKN